MDYMPYVLIVIVLIVIVLLILLRDAMKNAQKSYPPGTMVVISEENQEQLGRFLFALLRGFADKTTSPIDNEVVDIGEKLIFGRVSPPPVDPDADTTTVTTTTTTTP